MLRNNVTNKKLPNQLKNNNFLIHYMNIKYIFLSHVFLMLNYDFGMLTYCSYSIQAFNFSNITKVSKTNLFDNFVI